MSTSGPDESSLTETIARLDADFAEWLANLRPAELAELRLYQGVGYVRVNGLLRETVITEGDALRRTLLSIEAVDSAISKGSAAQELTVYRGIRASLKVFGVAELDELIGQVVRDPGYMSTTVDRDVALRMVQAGDDPTIVEVRLPVGQRCAWLGLAGQPSRRGEAELLLPRRTTLLVESIAAWAGLPMIRATVVA